MHPVFLAAAIGAGAAFFALMGAWMARGTATKAIMVALALMCVLPGAYLVVGLNPWLIDSRFRAYRKLYKEIEIGMTRKQVLATMERLYPAEGTRKRPTILSDTPESLEFFMNPESSREPNCEGIFLTLKEGRVVRKNYSPN